MPKAENIRLMCSLLWLGFVLAISFMEAPLKFQAASVSLPIGLEIGKIVFAALNKVEWTLMAVLGGTLVFSKAPKFSQILIIILLLLLLFQTLYLLPALNARADKIIAGQPVEQSANHILYIIAESIKVVLLIIATRHFFKPINKAQTEALTQSL